MIGLALMVLAAASPTDICMSVRSALPQAGVCVADADGIALATDEAAARALLDQAHVGAERFRAVFGRQPSRYAVFSFDDPSTAPSTSTALRALGFSAVLPLPSAMAQQRQMAETMRELQPTGGMSAAPRRAAFGVTRRAAPASRVGPASFRTNSATNGMPMLSGPHPLRRAPRRSVAMDRRLPTGWTRQPPC